MKLNNFHFVQYSIVKTKDMEEEKVFRNQNEHDTIVSNEKL